MGERWRERNGARHGERSAGTHYSPDRRDARPSGMPVTPQALQRRVGNTAVAAAATQGPAPLYALHRRAGNAAIAAALARPVVQRMRDFASARGALVPRNEKWHDDTFGNFDYRIIVRATDHRQLFYDGFTVRIRVPITADDKGKEKDTGKGKEKHKECLFVFNEAGVLLSNNLKDVGFPVAYDQQKLLLDAIQIGRNWAAGEPRLLTHEEIATIEEAARKAAASRKVKLELRGQVTILQLEELLDQYQEQQGYVRRLLGSSDLVKELRTFVNTQSSERAEDAPLEHNLAELKRPAELTGQVFLSLMLALGEAAGEGEDPYGQLLAGGAAEQVRGIDPEYVFVDSDGNVHNVVSIAKRLLEEHDFRNPLTGRSFSSSDEERLAGYPIVAAAIDRTAAGLRNQKAQVSESTIRQIMAMIAPISKLNQGEKDTREANEQNAYEAIGTFYEYVTALRPAERAALLSYRMPVEGSFYRGNEENTTFGQFMDTKLRGECNEAAAQVLQNVVKHMRAGTGGEVEADRWADLRRRAKPPRVQLPEHREEAESTEDVRRRRRDRSEKSKEKQK
jgi:hypothetical protein